VKIGAQWCSITALVVFYIVRGKIRIDAGPSRRRIQRFNGMERFAHWITAASFLVLVLTGLNLVFGRWLILPVLGLETFATMTVYGKLAHNFLSFPFVLGIVLMLLIWGRHNIPNGGDIAWIKATGGLFSKGKHPPAKKFNAGQKLIFWMVVAGGGGQRLRAAVPLRRDRHRRHHQPHLHRLDRDGRRVRRDGQRSGRRELGTRAP
jgi:formate dehydrogenase subunit gamma